MLALRLRCQACRAEGLVAFRCKRAEAFASVAAVSTDPGGDWEFLLDDPKAEILKTLIAIPVIARVRVQHGFAKVAVVAITATLGSDARDAAAAGSRPVQQS